MLVDSGLEKHKKSLCIIITKLQIVWDCELQLLMIPLFSQKE